VSRPESVLYRGRPLRPTRYGRRRLRRLDDKYLSGEEQRGDRCRILQRRSSDLGRLDDASLDHVDVLAGRRIEASSRPVAS